MRLLASLFVAGIVSAPVTSFAEPARIAYAQTGIDSPVTQAMWGDEIAEIEMLGGVQAVHYVEFDRGNDTYVLAQMHAGYACGVRDCSTKLMRNGRVMDLGVRCDATDHHYLSADKRTVRFCDNEVTLP